MKKSLFMLFIGCLFMSAQVMAQITVSGTITDEGGESLIGVNIVEKGTTNGTVTDLDGNYSIKVADGSTLVFSYVGFETVERLADVASISLTLSDANILDEVVVTALGISKSEKGLTYAVTQVDGDGITKARESNLLNSLSGAVAGVQVTSSSSSVGSSSRLVLRGVASISGNNQPLYVVDGVPIDGTDYSTADGSGGYQLPNGVSDMNSDDIETITVLKGGAAANLWGMRAANGVIVITTKKGTKNEKLGITFNSSTTFETPLELPEFQNSYGGGYDPNYFEFIDGDGGSGGIDESWGPPLDVGLEFVQWNSPMDENGNAIPIPFVSYPDGARDFFQTGVTTNNNLSFSGGLENVTYRFAFGQEHKKGMIYNTDFNKYNISAATNFNVTDKFSGFVSFNYVKSSSNNLPEVGYGSDNLVSQLLWGQRNVNMVDLKDWENLPLATAGYTGPGVPINWNTTYNNNPYWILETNLNKYDKNRVVGSMGLNYAFTDYLSLGLKSGIDYFSQFNSSNKAIGSAAQQGDRVDGYYREAFRNFSQINAEASLNFDHTVAEDYGFTAFLGGNLMSENYKRIFGTAPGLELPGLYNLSNVQSGATVSLVNFLEKQKINSVYGAAGFSWRSALFADFSFRNDWASVLPSDNRSFFYPAVGASFILTEFIPKNDYLTFLKVRGSWSKIGSVGVLDSYDIVQTYSFRQNPWGDVALVYDPIELNNPTLKPETTKTYEVGVDVRLFKNRLRIDYSHYNALGEDLIVPLQVSTTSGYQEAFQNVGKIRNKGHEIQVGATLYKNKDVTLDLDFNWAKNENIVESLGGLDAYVISDNPFDIAFQAREGMPYGLLVGRDFMRDDAGNVIFEEGLPVVNTDEIQVHGTVQPDWTGGARLSLSWKGLNFSTLINASIGGVLHTLGYQTGMLTGNYAETLIGRETGVIGEGVMESGTDGEGNPIYVPNDIVVDAQSYYGTAYDYSVSSPGIFDASYVKWKELIIGYSLPGDLFKHSVVDGISLSFVARNLLIIHKNVPHIDPETGFSARNEDIGQEFGQWPSTRSLGFNVNVKF